MIAASKYGEKIFGVGSTEWQKTADLKEARRVARNATKRQRYAARKAEARAVPPQAELALVPPAAPARPLSGGTVKSPDDKRRVLEGKGRFVFTAAQNNTELHEGFWLALQRYCKETDARLCVSRFTYNKAEWKKRGGITVDNTEEDAEIWYDPRIKPFIVDENVKITDGLVFCGELDILPTAATPLASLYSYTGPNSGIVPHAKVQLQSLATMKHEPAKMLYTTGACTLRNYIDRKAGQVATFHHVFGALVVEIDEHGDWFARQILASDDGGFYDLNEWFDRDQNGMDVVGPMVTLGDVHIEKMDHFALKGAMNMLDALQPEHVVIHDLIDFEARNHHNLKDPHFLAKQYYRGVDRVSTNMGAGARFLYGLSERFKNTAIHVIRSNHDQAFERWLKDPSAQFDAPNAQYWHYWNARWHAEIAAGLPVDLFAVAMREAASKNNLDNLEDIHFVEEDESLLIYDIEHGMHGHRGINGSKGNPKQFRQMGRKANTGHTHSAGILDGVYTAGVLAKLDMEYNSGPSSWSHSHILTYPNGKRCIITQRGSKWRA
jgi:hypothetical protein